MTENERRSDIERELAKLGWTSEEWGAHEVRVYQDYRPNKKYGDKSKPWEITVYCKWPVWEWDFVDYWDHYVDYNPSKGSWIHNMRVDYEFANIDDAVAVAAELHRQREQEFDEDFLPHHASPFKVAIQRVTDRPKSGTII